MSQSLRAVRLASDHPRDVFQRPARRFPISKFFLLFVLALGLLVYWPGLSGGYVFDDFGNLVDNPAFAQDALRAHFWHAIWSTSAGPLDRPLSMLTFAAQMVFTGLNPWPLKLANVLLHLCNGWLVWLLSSRVLGWLEPRAQRPWLVGAQPLALLATAAWVLAPIQLTAVLYVVQREEALAATFVLLGLLGYWHGRMRLIAARRGALAWIWGSLALGTVVAALAKETGVMLPAYALVLEWVVLRGALSADRAPAGIAPSTLRGAGGAAEFGLHPLVPVFFVLLVIPGALGLAWLLPGVLDGAAYAARPFTLSERLLTEGRVLVDYLRWIVLPAPNALSLYHDDIAVSTGWLRPWTTAASWAFLAALLLAALALRRRLPVFAFGVLWWFAGQSLVSTFVPLELVYEHRNYLPDWGIFLALLGLLSAWRPDDAERQRTLRLVVVGGFCALVALQGFFTSLRAQVWSNPYRLAYFEATTHPGSPRAASDLGRTLLMMSRDSESATFKLGMQQTEVAARLPDADLPPFQSLIFMSAKYRLPIDPKWWEGMESIIKKRPLSASGVNALYTLIACGISKVCHYSSADISYLRQIIDLAVRKNLGRADIIVLEANLQANLRDDYPRAYALMQRAVVLDPNKYAYWKNLFDIQMAAGLYGEAGHVLARMRELNRFGIHTAEIAKLRAELARKAQRAEAAPRAQAAAHSARAAGERKPRTPRLG